MGTWQRTNQHLTRIVMKKINALPTPVKSAAGLLPGMGLAMLYADNYKWSLLKVAEHYESEGNLSRQATLALASYKQALAAEQREYERLVRALEKEI